MVDYTWSGGAGVNWDTVANWGGVGGYPDGADDTATIDTNITGGSIAINIDAIADAACGALTLRTHAGFGIVINIVNTVGTEALVVHATGGGAGAIVVDCQSTLYISIQSNTGPGFEIKEDCTMNIAIGSTGFFLINSNSGGNVVIHEDVAIEQTGAGTGFTSFLVDSGGGLYIVCETASGTTNIKNSSATAILEITNNGTVYIGAAGLLDMTCEIEDNFSTTTRMILGDGSFTYVSEESVLDFIGGAYIINTSAPAVAQVLENFGGSYGTLKFETGSYGYLNETEITDLNIDLSGSSYLYCALSNCNFRDISLNASTLKFVDEASQTFTIANTETLTCTGTCGSKSYIYMGLTYGATPTNHYAFTVYGDADIEFTEIWNVSNVTIDVAAGESFIMDSSKITFNPTTSTSLACYRAAFSLPYITFGEDGGTITITNSELLEEDNEKWYIKFTNPASMPTITMSGNRIMYMAYQFIDTSGNVFVFPHNPEEYSCTSTSVVVKTSIAYTKAILENVGDELDEYSFSGRFHYPYKEAFHDMKEYKGDRVTWFNQEGCVDCFVAEVKQDQNASSPNRISYDCSITEYN